MSSGADMLIVEDDPDDLALLRRAFSKAAVDARYDVATDGDAAIAALEQAAAAGERPRVVLLDLKLPRRSGFEVLEWIRAHLELRRTPVVILTSSDTNRDLTRAYDLGANSYLVKPVLPSALTAMVANIDAYWLKMNAAA
jgi:DNA-binding response OmpR family regulator